MELELELEFEFEMELLDEDDNKDKGSSVERLLVRFEVMSYTKPENNVGKDANVISQGNY